jgi:hypothetical protein
MEQPKLSPEPTPSQEKREKYAELLRWLDTMVKVEEYYLPDDNPKQPIRNLFGKLRYVYDELIRMFIIQCSKGSPMASLDAFNSVIAEMSRMYEKIPRKPMPDYPKGVIYVGSKEYEQFFNESWKPMIRNLHEGYSKNEFVMFFLENFGSLYRDKEIYFELQNIKNLQTLFAEIAKLSGHLLTQLIETYNGGYADGRFDTASIRPYYSRWYRREGEGGGRKLSRRRKSNPKSKSKHKHKRRSYKKSSYRRQRH